MKNTKTTKAFCLIITFIFVFSPLQIVFAEKPTASRSVYMVNLETDSVVYGKNIHARMYPASLTKILTAVVVIDMCDNIKTTEITAPKSSYFDEIYKVGGANIAIKEGEKFTAEQLLYALMLSSACDAATTLAYHFGNGDPEEFYRLMNEKAKSIGALDSNFLNAHGLHEEKHYSTAYDIAKILEYAVSLPEFLEIICSRTYSIPKTNLTSYKRNIKYTVESFYPESNFYLENIIGGKSGFTQPAGRCLATYGKKDGLSFICVLMGANMDQPAVSSTQINLTYSDTFNLYSYAFENLALKTVISKETIITTLNVVGGKSESVNIITDKDYSFLIDESKKITIKTELPESLIAPVTLDKLGSAKIMCDDVCIATISLYAANEVEASSPTPPALTNPTENTFPISSPATHPIPTEKAEDDDTVLLVLIICLLVIMFICILLIPLLYSHSKKYVPKRYKK